MAWAKENGISEIGPEWERELLCRRIEMFKPDVIYMGSAVRYTASFLRSLPYKPKLILAWQGSDVRIGTDWSGIDIILSGLPRILSLAKALGAKEGICFLPGVPKWIAQEVKDIPHETDVVFIGGIYPSQHARRLNLINVISDSARRHGYSLSLHLSCAPELISDSMKPYVKGPVFGLEMHRALRKGRIVFDTQGAISLIHPDGRRGLDLADGYTVNMRIFEGTAGGSMVLTDDLANLSTLFEPNSEVAVFTNAEDLEEKILYYLENEDERIAIANRGRERCLSEWSMTNAAKRFMEIIYSRL